MQREERYYYGTKEELLPGATIGGAATHFSNMPQVEAWRPASRDLPGEIRIYLVQPIGMFETLSGRLPAGPAVSYRALHPLRVVAEVSNWEHLQEEINASLTLAGL